MSFGNPLSCRGWNYDSEALGRAELQNRIQVRGTDAIHFASN